MELLKQLAYRIKKTDHHRILNRVLSDRNIQEFILDLNRKNQLFDQGINSLGVQLSDIGGGYSPATELINQDVIFTYKGSSRRKITGESPFLYDDGIFFESFTIKLNKRDFEISANPVRGDTDLFSEWGSDIIGLTDQSKGMLIDLLTPLVGQMILRYWIGEIKQ